MKRKLALILGALMIASGVTAYAATNNKAAKRGLCLKMGKGNNAQIMMDVVSKLTGLKPEDITKELQNGKSFYEIAAEKGVTAEKFKEEVYNAKAAEINKKVADGTLTKEQGDAAKAKIKSNMDNWNGQGNGCGFDKGKGREMKNRNHHNAKPLTPSK
jgi:hypothetical protein